MIYKLRTLVIFVLDWYCGKDYLLQYYPNIKKHFRGRQIIFMNWEGRTFSPQYPLPDNIQIYTFLSMKAEY